MTGLELAELDLAVAKAEGLHVVGVQRHGNDYNCMIHPFHPITLESEYRPTRDGAQAMLLLEKHKLELHPARDYWECQDGNVMRTGETPCIAICKAVVALKGVTA